MLHHPPSSRTYISLLVWHIVVIERLQYRNNSSSQRPEAARLLVGATSSFHMRAPKNSALCCDSKCALRPLLLLFFLMPGLLANVDPEGSPPALCPHSTFLLHPPSHRSSRILRRVHRQVRSPSKIFPFFTEFLHFAPPPPSFPRQPAHRYRAVNHMSAKFQKTMKGALAPQCYDASLF
jgi:hypothetical protein